MWSNSADYVIASSKKEAVEILANHYAFKQPLSEEDLKILGNDVEMLDLDYLLSVYYQNIKITKTVLGWILLNGRGYFKYQI